MMVAGLAPEAAKASEVLITVAEAALADSPDVKMTTRSGAFGPEIELVTPKSDSTLRSPLPLKVKFVSKGTAVDPNSFKLFYLKSPLVDLTDRVKSHLDANGIEMLDAEVPPGTHVLRLHLKDTQGRMSVKLIKFTVAPK